MSSRVINTGGIAVVATLALLLIGEQRLIAQTAPADVSVAPPAAPVALPAKPLQFTYAGKFNPVDPTTPNIFFGGSPIAIDSSGYIYLAVANYGLVTLDTDESVTGVLGYPAKSDGAPAVRADGSKNIPPVITRGFSLHLRIY